MQPASPSDLSGPGRAWQGLTEPVQPVRWGSLGEPARTVPRLSESLVSPVGSFVGSVSSPFLPLRHPSRPRPVPCSAPLLLPSIHPSIRSSPPLLPPRCTIACIASHPFGPSSVGRMSFPTRLFPGLCFSLAIHHSPIRMSVCAYVCMCSSVRSSNSFIVYSICILAVIFISDLHGYLLIHPSFIH